MPVLSVVGCGMVTAIGFNAPATLAGLRAGVGSVRQSAWLDADSGEPLRAAKVALPQWWDGLGKLAELVAPAINECLQSAQPEPAAKIPLLIGTAHRDRPGRVPALDESLLEEVGARLGIALHAESKQFPADQTGCAHALIEAHRLIRDRLARFVIVAGVDSLLHQPTLDAYAERARLLTDENSNGFLPGEAGTAVLLQEAGADDGGAALHITGFGLAMEPAPIESTRAFAAQGLTQAVSQALTSAGLSMHDVGFRVTDVSGEHYKFKEAAFVAARLDSGPRDEPLELWHPIEYLGEIGAAILPCLLGWAAHAFRQGYGSGSAALCHVGSDSGERAALVLRPAGLMDSRSGVAP
jgi:3-oxoacyl-[acyl-carrier-protein] synthase-1